MLLKEFPGISRDVVTTAQINVGKYCNQTCNHCHVDAGPARKERMTAAVAGRIIELIARSPDVEVVDITGGAPELNENFRHLVTECRRLGKHVIDRCNLTVLLLPEQNDLASFLAESQVEIIASLPCYEAANVDKQRGAGIFEQSLRALRLLNSLGYGSRFPLNLVYNPVGDFLPPDQASLEERYRRELDQRYGIHFDRLFTITNMPISRFARDLERRGRFEEYMELLVEHFNPSTLPGLMCRNMVSVGWNGGLYDCDFNQMLGLELMDSPNIWTIDSFADPHDAEIVTGRHCFGCTAGAGSSCAGAVA